MKPSTIVKLVVGAVALIVVLCTVAGSFYQIDQGERGVLLRAGKAVADVDPGLNFKWPFLYSVVRFSTKSEALSATDDEAFTSDKQPIYVTYTVNVQLDPKRVIDIYSNYGQDYINTNVVSKLPDILKKLSGQYTIDDIINKRTEFGQRYLDNLRQALEPMGLNVTSVQLVNIKLDEKFTQAVVATQVSEQEAKKAANDLKVFTIQQQQNVVKAKADAEARNADTDATAYKTTKEGQAQADAVAAVGQALAANPRYIEYTIANRWQGQVPTSMVPGSAVPFINLPTVQNTLLTK